MNSTRPRDSQRQKVYDAEAVVFGSGHDPRAGRHFETVDEIDAYILKLVGSAWFQRRWPSVHCRNGTKTWYLRDGRGARRATGGMSSMSFPRWARHEAIILHELAHHIVERTKGYRQEPWHGWYFCSVFLELVERQLGKETADDLKAAMRKYKVRYRKPVKRELTDEQRAELRERLANARAMAIAARSGGE